MANHGAFLCVQNTYEGRVFFSLLTERELPRTSKMLFIGTQLVGFKFFQNDIINFPSIDCSSLFVEGCIIFYLVTVSTHEATTPNWLIVWLNPLCIIPAVCEWIKRAEKLLIWYQIINFAVLLLLVVAWPWLGQSANPAFVPMIATTMIRLASYVYITRNKESHKSN